MKKALTITLAAVLITAIFSGCSCFGVQLIRTTEPQETTAETTAETTEALVSKTEKQTEDIKTTDEFPTEGEDENNYTEPSGRWSVNVPEIWDKKGKIIESKYKKTDIVRFVYKKAYDEYEAGHVFSICTVSADKAVDVSTLPRAEEIYIDDNIQIYVDYPTDVQFGGIDGSEMESQGKEYNKLKNTVEDIIDSLNVK